MKRFLAMLLAVVMVFALEQEQASSDVGAGDGNRTHVSSLEGWCSTIELHPRVRSLKA